MYARWSESVSGWMDGCKIRCTWVRECFCEWKILL